MDLDVIGKMLSTMPSVTLELNSSYYTTVVGNSALDGFSVSVIEPENATSTLYMLPTYIRTTSMVVCIVVMVLGIIGNLMVPLVVIRGRDMRNSTNIFLVNLSVADLFVLLICTPTVLVEVNSGPQVWPLGEHMCKAVPFVELTVAHASVLTILAISFERYYAICEPLRAGYVCTKARATFLCFLAWVAAAFCTSPIIWVSQYHELRTNNGSVISEQASIESPRQDATIPVCLTQVNTLATSSFVLLLVILFFLVPLMIILVLYSLIVRRLRHDVTANNTSDTYLSRVRRQVTMMLLAVVLGFFLCLAPYRIFIVYIVLSPTERIAAIDRDTYFNLLNFSRIMLYLNSAVNPVLYNLMSSRFRMGLVRLWGFERHGTTERTVQGCTVVVFHKATTRDQEENFL